MEREKVRKRVFLVIDQSAGEENEDEDGRWMWMGDNNREREREGEGEGLRDDSER